MVLVVLPQYSPAPCRSCRSISLPCGRGRVATLGWVWDAQGFGMAGVQLPRDLGYPDGWAGRGSGCPGVLGTQGLGMAGAQVGQGFWGAGVWGRAGICRVVQGCTLGEELERTALAAAPISIAGR